MLTNPRSQTNKFCVEGVYKDLQSSSSAVNGTGGGYHYAAHYFSWDKGVVKLRNAIKINTNSSEIKKEADQCCSGRSSGETVVEELF